MLSAWPLYVLVVVSGSAPLELAESEKARPCGGPSFLSAKRDDSTIELKTAHPFNSSLQGAWPETARLLVVPGRFLSWRTLLPIRYPQCGGARRTGREAEARRPPEWGSSVNHEHSEKGP